MRQIVAFVERKRWILVSPGDIIVQKERGMRQMTEQEFLLEISNIIDIKLAPLKKDIQAVKFHIEQDVKPNIRILSENYLPAAQRYASATNQVESVGQDVELLKKVVAGHSEKLDAISA